MNSVDEILISDAQKSLLQNVSSLSGKANLDEVFASWLLPTENMLSDLKTIAEQASNRTGASRTYQDVAILGYSVEAGVIEASIVTALRDGLQWQAGRSTLIDGIPTGISQDAIALMGIALGTRLLADEDLMRLVSEWIAGFIHKAYEMRGVEDWHKCLFAATQQILHIKPEIPLPENDDISDVQVALSAKKLLPQTEIKDETEIKALYYLKSHDSTKVEASRAALSLAAYNTIVAKQLINSKNHLTAIEVKEMQTTPKKIKILFLGAAPKDQDRLRLDAEVREIDGKLQMAKNRDMFTIEQQWAVRVSDLQGHLLRYSPDIVHFSGHGSDTNEIILENNNGESHPVSADTLSGLFSLLKDNIQCVVLNACYSVGQAKAIAQHIDYVIGMSDSIRDDSAISFSAAFYQTLGYGKNIDAAFKLGCLQIDMENLDEGDIPQLFSRNDADH